MAINISNFEKEENILFLMEVMGDYYRLPQPKQKEENPIIVLWDERLDKP